MKTITLNIPTTRTEIKDFFLGKVKWFIHPLRMKHNKKILDEIFNEIYHELTSNYWSKDISNYMKETVTNPYNGKIACIIRSKKNKLI